MVPRHELFGQLRPPAKFGGWGGPVITGAPNLLPARGQGCWAVGGEPQGGWPQWNWVLRLLCGGRKLGVRAGEEVASDRKAKWARAGWREAKAEAGCVGRLPG